LNNANHSAVPAGLRNRRSPATAGTGRVRRGRRLGGM